MFTGIVRFIGRITEIIRKESLLQYAVAFPHEHLERGASVSIDGVCQTVVRIDGENVWFDAIEETLQKTTLGSIEVGDLVNIERSAKIGDEIGGHLLSGHIYGTATLAQIDGNIFTFTCPQKWLKYLFPKGFVALNGASLTVVDVGISHFTVHLIPETLKRTTFGQKKIGDRVNVEFDSLTQAAVETVERLINPLDTPT